MPSATIIRREIIVRGSFAYSLDNIAAAVDLLAVGTIGLDPWLVEAPLSDGRKCFDRLVDAQGDVSKVSLKPPA